MALKGFLFTFPILFILYILLNFFALILVGDP
jgi:hypothetical protein